MWFDSDVLVLNSGFLSETVTAFLFWLSVEKVVELIDDVDRFWLECLRISLVFSEIFKKYVILPCLLEITAWIHTLEEPE